MAPTSFTIVNADAEVARMADRPSAAARVCTIDPVEIPSTDHKPARRPCATLLVTM